VGKYQANGWQRKGKPIPNADLWKELWAAVQKHNINWHWVRGHSGNALNERVDILARNARLAITPNADIDEDALRLYARGTCKGNPGPGAWAAVLERGEETQQNSGAVESTTNNRMELMAVIGGLSLVPDSTSVYVVTTSDYVFMGATRWIHGWRKRNWTKKDGKPVSNQDLWQELERKMVSLDVHWVSGKGGSDKFQQGLEEAFRVAKEALSLEI
jgi:ribonuclease HI